MGGGSYCAADSAVLNRGRSPRGRGKHSYSVLAAASARSIPAWAGEAGQSLETVEALRVDPRVGGGSRDSGLAGLVLKGRSPRGRGKRRLAQHRIRVIGSIPAWAGEALDSAEVIGGLEVDPRVGGGSGMPRR